jgi:hypothetical protein
VLRDMPQVAPRVQRLRDYDRKRKRERQQKLLQEIVKDLRITQYRYKLQSLPQRLPELTLNNALQLTYPAVIGFDEVVNPFTFSCTSFCCLSRLRFRS